MFVDTTDARTRKLWANKVWWDYRSRSPKFDPKYGMVGDDITSYPIVMIDDFEKGPGDEIVVTASHLIGGRGAVGAEQIEGKETVQDDSTFKMKLDILRNGVKNEAVLSNKQKVPMEEMKRASRALRDWHNERRDVEAINSWCCNSRQTDKAYTSVNTPEEPDDRHIYRMKQGLGLSNDQTVGADTTAVFDVDVIPELINIAEAGNPPLLPWRYKGMDIYGMDLHPNVVQQLRKTSSKWYAEAQAALQGGLFKDNPIFSRAIGFKHNVVFFSDPYIVNGKNSSTGAAVPNSRRNVLFGAGHIMMGHGVISKNGDKDALLWHQAEWDAGMKQAVYATLCRGTKTIKYKTQDGVSRLHGAIIVVSYAPELTFKYQIPAGPVGSFVESYDKGQPQ